MESERKAVWNVFVGNNGQQLEVLNSKSGPFPPQPGTEGHIAIGWPAIGDLRMYEGRYDDYIRMFRTVYHEKGMAENVFKTKANMPWRYAFEMKEGDWVISPCSTHELILAGAIVGPYLTDFHDELGFYGKRGSDFVHLRQVKWQHVIRRNDPRYGRLNRIGQLTISRSHLTFDDLQEILMGKPVNVLSPAKIDHLDGDSNDRDEPGVIGAISDMAPGGTRPAGALALVAAWGEFDDDEVDAMVENIYAARRRDPGRTVEFED